VFADLYVDKETDEAMALVRDLSQKELFGDIDTVIKSLSAAILRKLQDPFGPY